MYKRVGNTYLNILIWSHTVDYNRYTALDRLTRGTLINNRALYPNSAIERLYLARNQGGRGLINIEATHNIQIQSTNIYQ